MTVEKFPSLSGIIRAQCYKTDSRMKLLYKMEFLLGRVNFQNSIAIKNLF